MAVTPKSEEQIDAAKRDGEWWDAWWEADYSWSGLAKKPWQCWFVNPDGSVRGAEGEVWPPRPPVVIPAEGSEATGEPGPISPLVPQPADGSRVADAGASLPGMTSTASSAPSVSDLRSDPPPPLRGGGQPATLQDYWRRDPETGAVRTDAEMEASGELVRDPSGALWHVVHMPPEWRGQHAGAPQTEPVRYSV